MNKDWRKSTLQCDIWKDTKEELPTSRDDVIICNSYNQCVSVGRIKL